MSVEDIISSDSKTFWEWYLFLVVLVKNGMKEL